MTASRCVALAIVPLVSILLAAACHAPVPIATRIPLWPGVAPRGQLRCINLDATLEVAAPVGLELDCRPLPYAKGEERAFAVEWGNWFVVPLAGEFLVVCNCGEFGGFVQRYGMAGHLVQTLSVDNANALVFDDGTLLVVAGLSHLYRSQGAIHAFRRGTAEWPPLGSVTLPCEPVRVTALPDGELGLEMDSIQDPSPPRLEWRTGIVTPARAHPR